MVTKSIENAVAPVPKVWVVIVWAEQIVERDARAKAEQRSLLIYLIKHILG